MGTFNVNGKMPSQDLSSWVGGRSSIIAKDEDNKETDGRKLPPLKRLSSLSLGDFGNKSLNLEGAVSIS